MKSAQLAAALAGVCLVTSAIAVPSPAPARPAASPPAPAIVVNPTGLPRSLSGAIINVEFQLDAAGRPHDIRLPSVYDPAVARQLRQAFSQWQFSPVPADASARRTRFVLPLEIKP